MRGTITSRAMVSPSSKTEWIIFRSPDSITADASARSTSSRSSVSVENGPSRKPRPGVIALPIRISSRGSGPRTVVTTVSGRGGGERDPLGVLAAQGARGDPDHHERDDQHDPDRGAGGGHQNAPSAGVADQLGDDHVAAISQSSRSRSAVLR